MFEEQLSLHLALVHVLVLEIGIVVETAHLRSGTGAHNHSIDTSQSPSRSQLQY